MKVNTGGEEGGSKKVKLTLSHDDEQFGLLYRKAYLLALQEDSP